MSKAKKPRMKRPIRSARLRVSVAPLMNTPKTVHRNHGVIIDDWDALAGRYEPDFSIGDRLAARGMWDYVQRGKFYPDVLLWLRDVASSLIVADKEAGVARLSAIASAVGFTGEVDQYQRLRQGLAAYYDFASMEEPPTVPTRRHLINYAITTGLVPNDPVAAGKIVDVEIKKIRQGDEGYGRPGAFRKKRGPIGPRKSAATIK